jgi:glycosyltransferase involved in cell wall biosynthesis
MDSFKSMDEERQLTTRPTITVVIDTYNYGHFIEQAIDSVLSQGFAIEDVEIVIVDDGSTDGTGERIKNKYGPQVRYFYKSNGGQASAFNLGFQHARGEIVALLDADDYFLPGKLRRIVDEFASHPEVGMVYHSRLELLEKTSDLRTVKFKCVSGFLPDNKNKLADYDLLPTSCLSFRRSILDRLLPIPESLRLQADSWPALLMVLVAPIIALPEPLFVYRIHGKNLFHTEGSSPELEQGRRRNIMSLAVIREAEEWAFRHKSELKWTESRLLLGKWLRVFEHEQFALDPPGRIEFLLFMLRENLTYSPMQTWKLTAMNYLASPLALIFGYRNAKSMYEWRGRLMRATERLYGRVFGRARTTPRELNLKGSN